MPVYDLAAVAEALDRPGKQIDNILSRNNITGIEHTKRGVTRRIALDAVLTLRVALELVDAVGLSIPAALDAAAIIRERRGTLQIGSFGRMVIDLDALEESTVTYLNRAVETVGRRARGRRPRRMFGRERDQSQ